MKTTTSSRPRSWKQALSLLPVVMLCGGLALTCKLAQAAPPAAGVSIGNQATATYSDGSATERFAQSNVVKTNVLQIASVDLTNDNNSIRTAGAPVYFTHTVKNTGNGPDSFDITFLEATGAADNFNIGAQIYTDTNDDGIPETLLTDTDGDGFPNTPLIAAGATYKFIVVGSVPVTATAGQTGKVAVTATGNFGTPFPTDTNNDTVTVTSNAAMTIIKKQSISTGGPNSLVTYTLEYTNTGNQSATNLEITDDLAANLAYEPGSGLWNGVAVGDNKNSAATAPAGVTYVITGQQVKAVISTVPTNSTGRIVFQARVRAATAPGVITNNAGFKYDDDNNAATADKTGTSNSVDFNVAQTPSLTFAGQNVPSTTQGAVVSFNNILTNTGNGVDTFDIEVSGPGTFPAGTAFQLFQSDGQTALLDTNNNQIPDTGPVNPAGTYTVVLKAILPPTASGNNGGPGFTVNKVATSNGPGKPQATATDSLGSITASTVNVTNGPTDLDGNPATGVPVTVISGNPGTTQTFQINVINNSASSDTYALSVSSTNAFSPVTPLPAGFNVTFRDSNGAVVSNTGSIGAGVRKVFTAQVTIPAGASAQNVDLYFRARSGSTGAQDVKLDRLTVNQVRLIAVEADNAGQIYLNSTTTYAHIVTNKGNATESNIALTTSGDANGFSSVLYLDANNNGELDPAEAAAPYTSIPSLAPGATVSVIVKVFSPLDGVGSGTVNTTVVTATLNGVAISDSANDTTTLVVGDLQLDKFQAIDPDGVGSAPLGSFSKAILDAKPGAYIRYRITVTNSGAANVTNVRVSDSVPVNGYTTYFSGDNSTSQTLGRAVWTVDGTTFNNPETGAPSNGGTGSFLFVIPLLKPQETATITFGVKINE